MLELTERELIKPTDITRQLFDALHQLGVMIAIDDFGTGHSSLGYLRNFNVDYLKIDQSFVAMIGADALSRHILDSIIELSGKLDLGIVAEGCESGTDYAVGETGLRVDVALVVAFLLLAGSTTGEVGLMLLALGVGEVGAVVLVDGEAEAALEGAQVVLEDVGVLVEVDGLEGQLAEALATVGVGCAVRSDAAAAELGASAVLVVHLGDGWWLCGALS